MHSMIDRMRCGGEIVNEIIEDDDSIHKNLGPETFLLRRRINQEDDPLYVEQIGVESYVTQGRESKTLFHIKSGVSRDQTRSDARAVENGDTDVAGSSGMLGFFGGTERDPQGKPDLLLSPFSDSTTTTTAATPFSGSLSPNFSLIEGYPLASPLTKGEIRFIQTSIVSKSQSFSSQTTRQINVKLERKLTIYLTPIQIGIRFGMALWIHHRERNRVEEMQTKRGREETRLPIFFIATRVLRHVSSRPYLRDEHTQLATQLKEEKEKTQVQEPSLNGLKALIWKLKVPRKIKHFLWQALSDSIKTSSRLVDRHCRHDRSCMRCCSDTESVNHLMFTCPPALQAWVLSNITSSPGIFPSNSLYESFDYLFLRAKRDGRKRSASVFFMDSRVHMESTKRQGLQW
ncbi:hypothetical protein YC2023_089746 [Brassica napus]